MNKDKLQKLKTQKYFKKADIIAYLSLAVLIVVLFWVFVFSSPKTTLDSVNVFKQSKTQDSVIFNYDFTNKTYTIADGYSKYIEIDDNSNGILVKIYTEDMKGYNLIQITQNDAYVVDANCSFHQDCMQFPHINGNNDVIICVPHNLTLIGVGEIVQGSDDPIIG